MGEKQEKRRKIGEEDNDEHEHKTDSQRKRERR
jgi:hypothetical protein